MGAALGYLSTVLSLFKTLFDSPQIMISSVAQEHQTKEKSEKSDLIRSLSSVFNQAPLNMDAFDEIDSAGVTNDNLKTGLEFKLRAYSPGSAKLMGRSNSLRKAFLSSNKTKKEKSLKLRTQEAT